MSGLLARVKRILREQRARHRSLDHAIRAYQRASAVQWSQVAGGITYSVFLALFPILALAFAAVGVLTAVYPGVHDAVRQAIESQFPGLLGDGPRQLQLDDVEGAASGATIIGALGLLWTGTGAVDAVRTGLRTVFGTVRDSVALPLAKLRDVVVMLVLGVLVLASVGVSATATNATSHVLDLAGLQGDVAAALALRVLELVVALALNFAVLGVLFTLLSGRHLSFRQLRGGALLGAVLLEALKLLATRLIGGAFTNPLYAGFAVIVALLLWINFSARVLMLASAWVATEPSVLAQEPSTQAVSPERLALVVDPRLSPQRSLAGRLLPVLGLAALVGAVLRRQRRAA